MTAPKPRDGRQVTPIEAALQQAREALAADDYPATVAAAEKAAELARSAGEGVCQAEAHLLWGKALDWQGELEAARQQYEQGLSLAKESGSRKLEAQGLRDLGMLSFVTGEYAHALPHLGQALSIARQMGDQDRESQVLVDLGTIFRRQGDYGRARSYLEQGLSILSHLETPAEESRALGNLGSAYLNLGAYAQAKALYEQALQITREANNRSRESFRLHTLGLLSHLVGDNQTAREYFQEALRISEEIGDPDLQGYALTGLGHTLLALGQTREAADVQRRALALRREMNQFFLAMESMSGLAEALMAQDKLDAAQAQVEEILACLEEHSLEGADQPIRVYLTCYRVLQANQDPRAKAILSAADRLLRKRAVKIRDEDLRRSFLEKVAAHREVLAKTAEWHLGQETAREKIALTADDPKRLMRKTKEELVTDLIEAHHRVTELEVLTADLKQAEETVWEEEQRFQSIAETASDAIIIFDTYENIYFWNPAAQKVFGYRAGEAHGQPLASILAPEFHHRFRQDVERVIATGESGLSGKTIEVTGIRKDGDPFPLELSVGTWKTRQEIFFTAIGRDITDRKQAEEALQKAYAEVEHQVQQRTAELQREIAEREHLQQEVIEAQQRAIQELSTPIIPVMDRIIVMPLIGSIDTMRARDVTRRLLAGIREHQAAIVILDITGVPIIDSGIAAHLNKTVQAARLKGARTIVTGISEVVAETIVDLGIDWSSIETQADLRTGLLAALRSLGITLHRRSATIDHLRRS